MGDALPWVLGGVAGGAVQQQMNLRRFRKEQAKIQTQLAEIQANEVSAAGTEELNTALGNINAALIGNMRDPTGPTAAALRRNAIQTAQSDITRQRTSIILRSRRQRRAADFRADQAFFRGTTQDLLSLGKAAASFAGGA